jgi:DNA repair exonuclease SbcCD nuclease subunit
MREERMDDCLHVLDEIGKLAKKHDAIIINGGDTFNTRGLIKTSCFDALYIKYKEWDMMGLKQYIVVGNHDQEDKAGEIHPMRVFENFEGWRVFDKPAIEDGICFFPYMLDINKEMIEETMKLSKRKKLDAVVHWGITGAMMNDGYADPEGVPVELLSPFRTVWSGHYHYANKIKNVQYIGSPFQQNFGEMNNIKGCWLWDKVKNKSEFIPIERTSKHYEYEYNSEKEGLDFRELNHSCIDFVRVKVKGEKAFVNSVTKEDVRKAIGPNKGFKVQRDIIDIDCSRLDIKKETIGNTGEILGKYVDFVSTELDKKRLRKIGMELLDA